MNKIDTINTDTLDIKSKIFSDIVVGDLLLIKKKFNYSS